MEHDSRNLRARLQPSEEGCEEERNWDSVAWEIDRWVEVSTKERVKDVDRF